MTDREALLRVIRENPACDTARLVYADFLDERGDPDRRAGFIRYQLAYEWHREHNGHPLHTAENEYPRASGVWPYEEWPDSAHSIFEMNGDALRPIFPQWRRGFVEEIDLPFGEFWPRVKKLFRAHPVLAVHAKGKWPIREGERTFAWRVTRLHAGNPRGDGYLPSVLRHHLKGSRNKKQQMHPGHSRFFRYAYASEADALVDLNRACVRYGRWLVDLSPLPEPEVVQS